jgi:hypothetical protein
MQNFLSMPTTNGAIAERVQYAYLPPQQKPAICQLVQWLSLGLDDKTIVVELLAATRHLSLLQSVRNGQLLIQREWEPLSP